MRKKIWIFFVLIILVMFSNCKNYKSISSNLESCINEIKRSYKCNDDTTSKFPLSIVRDKKLKEGEICDCVKIDSSNIAVFKNEIIKNDILSIWIYDINCIFFEIESQNNLFKEKKCFICYIVNDSRLKHLDFVPQDVIKIRDNWYYLERHLSY